jgi:hypothetical protein
VLLQDIEHSLVEFGHSIESARQMAPGHVFQMLQQQVAVLAYADVFIITGCLALVMAPLALLLVGGRFEAKGGAE